MPKILYFITKSNWGGAQRHVYDLATSQLVLSSFDVKIYAGKSGIDNKLFDKIEIFNNGNHANDNNITNKYIKTEHINLENNFNIYKSFLNLFEIYKILKDEKPNIIHLHSSKISLMISIVARIYNLKIFIINLYKKERRKQSIKIIYTAHGWIHNEPKAWPIKKALQIMMFITVILSDKTICVSQHTRNTLTKNKLLQKYFYKKIIVIYNGIDQNQKIKLPKLRETINNKHYGKINLVSIGELHHNKGHDTVIKYMSELKNVHYHIIGEGIWRSHLEKLITNNKSTEVVSNKITLHGHIDNAADTLSQYDIFLMPSRKEGFAYTILEALNAGIPVIARDVGGVAEINAGLSPTLPTREGATQNINIIPTSTPLTLYKEDYELIKILKNFNDNNLNKYNHWIDDRFSVDTMTAKTIEVYKI